MGQKTRWLLSFQENFKNPWLVTSCDLKQFNTEQLEPLNIHPGQLQMILYKTVVVKKLNIPNQNIPFNGCCVCDIMRNRSLQNQAHTACLCCHAGATVNALTSFHCCLLPLESAAADCPGLLSPTEENKDWRTVPCGAPELLTPWGLAGCR